MENGYIRERALDDPAKPWRRVFSCPATGLFVKLHAKRINAGRFGRLSWSITGALCDATGAALRGDDGAPLVHTSEHRFSVSSDNAGTGTPDEMRAGMATDFERQCLFVVARVEAAALKREHAATL